MRPTQKPKKKVLQFLNIIIFGIKTNIPEVDKTCKFINGLLVNHFEK